MGPISAKQTCTPASCIYCQEVEQTEKNKFFILNRTLRDQKPATSIMLRYSLVINSTTFSVRKEET